MEATGHFSTRDAARILESTEARVRHWARLGGIIPETGPGGRLEFTFQQLILLRTTRGLLEAGIPPRQVRRIWMSLRRQLADDLPLTRIRILANGDRAVAWDGNTSWQPDSGQFLLDFDAAEIAEHAGVEPDGRAPARVVATTLWNRSKTEESRIGRLGMNGDEPAGSALEAGHRAPIEIGPSTAAAETSALSAEQWFHLACELESTSPIEAREAYQQALAADDGFGDAHLNLGRLFHEAGELGKAEAHYRSAVRCTPDDAIAHFNLAVLLEDRGRSEEAVLAYRQAIARDPEAADAHHNLALLLETKGRRTEAMKHLMIARQLYASTGRGH